MAGRGVNNGSPPAYTDPQIPASGGRHRVAGTPELRTAAESDVRHFSCHKRGGAYVQPANLDVDKLVRAFQWRIITHFVFCFCGGGLLYGVSPSSLSHHLVAAKKVLGAIMNLISHRGTGFLNTQNGLGKCGTRRVKRLFAF